MVDERAGAAERKIGEIDAALAALDRADREAVERWAETAEGEPPAALLDERKALLARRVDAEAERQAAQVAVAAVANRRTALIGDMNRVGARIRERLVATAVEKARELHAEVAKLAGEIGAKMQRIEALRLALIDAGAEAASKKNDTQTAIFQSALSEVQANMRAPEVLADPATVARFQAEWREAMR